MLCRVVEAVLEELERHFDIVPGAEVSLEANPNTFEREKFLGFRAAGINRLSLGVQALNIQLLPHHLSHFLYSLEQQKHRYNILYHLL